MKNIVNGIEDDFGNTLYDRNGAIFLKLATVDKPRKIARFLEDKIIEVHRITSKHLFRKNKSFGFNDCLLKYLLGYNTIKLVVDDRDVFFIPFDFILSKGKYLFFKEQGFERQIFLPTSLMQKFKI